ncbi:integral membrane protein [Melanomma pulvis-pyrius CBS 109.77]|uniref:Integral membrane protein n=1 Tax=Melanomma pulvis-pyrius CBS 109.77 TaxID=1314802 RepID=A0A6A6WX06_9PLEO|nr:integral membrane protein [Melanomma pulvis-pyrius CBS 109.77]
MPSLQPSRPPPRPRRKRLPGAFSTLLLFFFAVASLLPLSSAVFINFENCLSRSYRDDPNALLQFVPLHVWATFNTTAPSHNLNVTIYGNVTGQVAPGNYPDMYSPDWTNPNITFGKIVDVSPTNPKYTTLFSDFKVVTYTAYSAEPKQFCSTTVNTACPIGPTFFNKTGGPANASDPYQLSAFTVGHDFYSTYSFATFSSNMRILSGDATAQTLGCIAASITPDLGDRLADALCYLPAAVLALVAIATVFAATCSPWGTSNIFRWSSNYGRDEDLLRLVTPGFGDCLQYIQFIVLAGSLNLNYPGFFQPVVSQASWSVLLFNESLVSHGPGSQSLVDGIYFANGTYGLSRLGQYVGMSEEQDIWAGMAIWLLGIIAAVTVIVQLGFLGQWLFRFITNTQASDLRGKNWPFTAGNIVRIVFHFFMLPIISISLFQLVVAPHSPASVVASAVVLLIGVVGFVIWIFWLIFTTRPRAHLFDDLPTALTYGPLYNTYSDDAAPFAFIPVLLTIIRGIAIGAIQPSGIAQIIILAICEVILILTLHAFRPFQSNTSMNAYHTFFSAIRLFSTLLMIAFVPSLGVAESPKGWIGYSILLLHAFVLVFGFFLNSLQTLIEVAARLTGAGADQRGGLTKVFGKRQLSKRNHRNQRSSLNSDAAMLSHDDSKSIQLMGSRPRSLSGSSAILLNQNYGGTGSQRASGFDQISQGGDLNGGGTSPGTPGINPTPWSYIGGGSGQSSRRPTMGTTLETADPYYRPPRARKGTLESGIPGVQGRGGSTDLTNTPYADNADQPETGDVGEGPSSWSPNRSSITPAYLRMHKDDSDPALAERRKNTDYSVRESDFYYHGLRGPALSAQPTRKLKTGPADPMGPVSSATGWFKSLTLFGAKSKEKGKGFEVVRSTRVPPQMMPLAEHEESPPISQEPYRDSPGTPPSAKRSPQQESPATGIGAGLVRVRTSDSSDSDKSSDDSYDQHVNRVSDMAPTLGPIETGGGIELPSRIGSRASRSTQGHNPSRAPTLPRKSSRRTHSTDMAILDTNARLSTVLASPPGTPGRMSAHIASSSDQHLHPNPSGMPIRLPFGSANSSQPSPSPSPERTPGNSAASSIYHGASEYHHVGPADELVPPRAIQSNNERPLSTGYVHQHMAGDSMHTDMYDAGSHLEASAEFVDRSRSISTQQSGNSHRSR